MVVEGEVEEESSSEVSTTSIVQTSGGLSTAQTQGIAQGRDLSAAGTKRIKEADSRIIAPRNCDFCIMANRCPKYEAGASCAFGLTETYLPADIEEHIDEDMGDLLAVQKDRILQGYLEEKMDASGLNKDVSREMRLYAEMVSLHREGKKDEISITAKAKGTGIMQMFSPKPGK